MELLGTLVGFTLTLFVFSYIFGDNILFRVAIHIFVGVSAGIVAVIVCYNVIWPQLIRPMLSGSQTERMFLLLPLIMCLLVLAKLSQRISGLGALPIAYLVGVGAAAAVGGALMGTIFPQVGATINLFDLGAMSQSGKPIGQAIPLGVIMLIGTLSTLIYFQFGTRAHRPGASRRAVWLEMIAWAGQGFIAITLGALFAGVYAAALTAWVERLNFLVKTVLPFIKP
jgi:hypothetical protein